MASESGSREGISRDGDRERRSGQERRVPTDRRQVDQPIGIDDQRQAERRDRDDRRHDGEDAAEGPQPEDGERNGDDDDKRAGLDRREASDRRSAGDRRQKDEAITFPERRQSKRRSAEDRRGSRGRRVEDDEVPMLDWFKEEREASRRRERKRRTIAALIFVLALVPAGVAHLYFKYRTPPPPPPSPTERSKVVAKPDPFKTMKTRKRPTGRRATVKKQEEIDRRLKKIERLRADLLNIAPDTYGSVRLQLVSGRYVDETNLAAEDELTVRAIQIHVISEKWDAMSSADKIKLLRVTYSMLRARYPALTQFVSLRFDDGRKDLDLRFDDDELVVE